jgi:hypothetical protein
LLRAHVRAHGTTTIPDRQRKLANQMAAAEIENSLSGFNRERREDRHAPRDDVGTFKPPVFSGWYSVWISR